MGTLIGFKGLEVWNKAKTLAVELYKITSEGDFKRDFSLRDQMRRAAVSISSNIAEGDALATNKQAVKYFYIARGSTAEVLTQAIIAHEIGYINKAIFNFIEAECESLLKMLTALIYKRVQKPINP